MERTSDKTWCIIYKKKVSFECLLYWRICYLGVDARSLSQDLATVVSFLRMLGIVQSCMCWIKVCSFDFAVLLFILPISSGSFGFVINLILWSFLHFPPLAVGLLVAKAAPFLADVGYLRSEGSRDVLSDDDNVLLGGGIIQSSVFFGCCQLG